MMRTNDSVKTSTGRFYVIFILEKGGNRTGISVYLKSYLFGLILYYRKGMMSNNNSVKTSTGRFYVLLILENVMTRNVRKNIQSTIIFKVPAKICCLLLRPLIS
jgi:hypothetical protein